jgi:hypothetical protein
MPLAPRSPDRPSLASLLLATGAALLVSACGGAGDPTGSTPDTAPDSAMHSSAAAAAADAADTGAAGEAEVATGTTVLELTQDDLADSDAARVLSPAFHVAPALLDPPQDTDVLDADASAASPPVTTEIPAGLDALRTGGLTAIAIKAALDAMPVATVGKELASAPTRKSVATYTPAQIRAAYGLPTLPGNIASLSAAQAAQFGAGQTIYIVNAHHGPNIVAELAAFNTKFGLPACTTRAIAPTASRPLAPPAQRSCDFSVVHTTAAGAMTSTAPTYDAGWATEIALDVQWAHAIAPLARIVLVEASDASVGSLVAAIRLANTLGPGVVSMSFGGPEGHWTASVDSAFTAPGMSYLAATGDSGAQVNWPSVSSNVLAVGGTSLTWTGSGTRSEVGWSGTGGGISAFVPAPAYQAVTVPGMGSLARRSVADVAFNADPSTGQFVATIAPGRASPRRSGPGSSRSPMRHARCRRSRRSAHRIRSCTVRSQPCPAPTRARSPTSRGAPTAPAPPAAPAWATTQSADSAHPMRRAWCWPCREPRFPRSRRW